MKIEIEVTHKVGDIIDGRSRKYTVIGYDYIESRGSRVCVAYIDQGKVEWLWLHPCEIDMLTSKE